MYIGISEYCLKKRKRFFLLFLTHVFSFLNQNPRNIVKEDTVLELTKIIHGATAITAMAPLLNLNLNYEKLHHKDSKFYLLNNIYDANFCIL